MNKLRTALFAPVSVMSLVIFRITYGSIMLWEVIRYLEKDWIKKYWIEPKFNFAYEWFMWVKPWEGDGMYFHFYLLGILSVLIILGLFYRVATVLMFFAFTYVFLLEQSCYLNHFYLIVLVSFLMIFVPAHKKYSLDVLIWKNLKSDFVPAWSVFLIAFQIGVAYFFGSIAKMNYDWLMLAEPMHHWLNSRKDFPLIGGFFGEQWMAYLMAWSGMFLDLLAPFLLLNRRTRPFMFAAILAFHFMNDRLFSIGIFPWFMIPASTIFFKPGWFNDFIAAIKNNYRNQRVWILAGTAVFALIGTYFHGTFDGRRGFEPVQFIIAGFSGAILVWLFIDFRRDSQNVLESKTLKRQLNPPVFAYNNLIVALIGGWVVIQILMPLRHCIIPGDVSWTEEGHRFSWHMKLRSKAGSLKFFAFDPVAKTYEEMSPVPYLSKRQYDKMSTRPYMIHQFARFLDKELEKQGKGNYEVHVSSYARLNFRPYQLLINPEIDLSQQTYSDFRHHGWVYQLSDTLKPASVNKEEGEDADD